MNDRHPASMYRGCGASFLGWPVALSAAMIAACAFSSGCVRRTVTINTAPEGALVYLNDHEIGFSPADADFTWYGDYDLTIRKDGFETLQTHVVIRKPWYQIIPIDFFAEVLYPGWIHDQRHFTFPLTPRQEVDREALISRASEMRASISETAASDDQP